MFQRGWNHQPETNSLGEKWWKLGRLFFGGLEKRPPRVGGWSWEVWENRNKLWGPSSGRWMAFGLSMVLYLFVALLCVFYWVIVVFECRSFGNWGEKVCCKGFFSRICRGGIKHGKNEVLLMEEIRHHLGSTINWCRILSINSTSWKVWRKLCPCLVHCFSHVFLHAAFASNDWCGGYLVWIYIKEVFTKKLSKMKSEFWPPGFSYVFTWFIWFESKNILGKWLQVHSRCYLPSKTLHLSKLDAHRKNTPLLKRKNVVSQEPIL